MGYQALLFCPDEKLARVVSQVFSELDFTIEPVHEPFAAVKKLMAQRYDSIVVDCENEQNASLLFKSARNSSFNQSTLAIALVEGQAGVAKAYRIGANLVLTKPINVEQAKGTLRVARGLLRKNLDAAGASAASAAAPVMPAKAAPVPAGSSFQPATRSATAIPPAPSRTELPKFEAPLPAGLSAMTSSARVEDQSAVVPVPPAHAPTQTPLQARTMIAAEPTLERWQPASPSVVKNDVIKSAAINNDVVKNDAVKNEAASSAALVVPVQNPSYALTSAPGSAAAPAPAKEVTAPPAKENASLEPAPASPSDAGPPYDAASVPVFSSVGVTDAPSFAALDEESGGSGGHKKILVAAAVILVLAGLGYLGYEKFGTSQNSRQPAPNLTPTSSAVTPRSAITPDRASSQTQTPAPKTAAAAPHDNPSSGAGNPPVIRIAANPEPGTKKPDSAPIVVQSNAAGAKTQAQAEESATPPPSPLAVAPANDSNLSGLMSSASPSGARPSLATVRISQGVSQGLLIKSVQPKYPPAALAIHAAGAVRIEATINKEGTVSDVKVLSGDTVLARAAVEAVRQWRYKPY